MKKFMLVAAILTCLGSLANADTRNGPTGAGNALATSDYGGVDYSTVTFSSASVQCFSGPGVFQGLIVSSFTFGSPPPFILIRDTNSITGSGTDYATTNEVFRVVLETGAWVNGMTNSNAGGVNNFYYKPPHPIKVRRGLVIKGSDNTIRSLTPIWTKFGN